MTSADHPGGRQKRTPAEPPPPPVVGYPPPSPTPSPTAEPLAVAALVLGIASLPLFFLAFLVGFSAVVVGTAALLRLRRRPDRSGRAMACIGIATGLLSIPVGVAIVAAMDHPRPFERITVPYARLNLGDCYQRPLRLDRDVEVVSCEQEHDRQALGAFEHPTPLGVGYPGEADLVAFADAHCRPAFTRFVDLPAEQAGLVVANQVPTPLAWEGGSRHVVCAVARRDGRRITGSVTDDSVQLPPANGTPG